MVSDTPDQRLTILLVDDDQQRAGWLQAELVGMGFAVHSIVDDPMRVLRVMSDVQPDVVVIDMASPGRDILESLSILAEHQPTPVVMFTGEEDPDYISKAVDAGVSAYIVGTIDTDKVKPVIEVAIAQFHHFQRLRTELKQTQSELAQSKAIDQAKRMLMRSLGLSEAEAYEHLRGEAMNTGAKIGEVAERVIKQKMLRGTA
ncbi:MAG: ANTAR domain-containing protein [Pseudomonadota bacterium]